MARGQAKSHFTSSNFIPLFFFLVAIIVFVIQLTHPLRSNYLDNNAAKHKSKDFKLYWLEVYKTRKSLEDQCGRLGGLKLADLEASMAGLDFLPEEIPLVQNEQLILLSKKSYFFVVMLRASESSTPTLLFELLKLVMLLRPKADDVSNVFISVILSGFHDSTALEVIGFQRHLRFLGIAHSVKMELPPADIKTDKVRIAVWERNKALEPLLLGTTQYDHVVFFQDAVFVCASAMARLLLSGTESDLVCAGDYSITPATNNVVLRADQFRNIDVNGELFQHQDPFVADPTSQHHHQSGRGYHVFSCWSGAVVVSGHVFQRHQLRFRPALPLECDHSEVNLLTKDMWATGLSKIAINPHVYAVYDLNHVSRVIDEFSGAPFSHDIRDQPPIAWGAPRPLLAQCCSVSAPSHEFPECFPEPLWWWYKVHGVPQAPSNSDLEASIATDPSSPLTLKQIAHAIRDERVCESAAWSNKDNNMNARGPSSGIPERIVQIWHTDNPYKLPLSVLFGLLSWMDQNPCYEFELVSLQSLDSFVSREWPEMHPLYRRLTSLQQRLQFGSYMYMSSRGGVYVMFGTLARKPLSQVIAKEDELLVGKETDFWDEASHLHWGYPGKVSLTPAVWATTQHHPALSDLIKLVAANIQSPMRIYELMRRHRAGRTSYLETMWKTGSGPFTETILDHASRNPRIHTLPLSLLHTFQHDPLFAEASTDLARSSVQPALADIFDLFSWRKWGSAWQRLDKHMSPLELGVGSVLLDGDYLFGLEEDFGLMKVLWESPRNEVFPTGEAMGPMFMWLRSSRIRGDGQGCVEVYRGMGPADKAKQLGWSACWEKESEADLVLLTLDEDRVLNVKTLTDLSCLDASQATNSDKPAILWASEPAMEHHVFDAAFVTQTGQLTVGQTDTTLNELQTTMMRVSHGVRGFCHEQFSLKAITVQNLEQAITVCINDPDCYSFTYKMAKDKSFGRVFMCSVPMRSKATKSKRWVMGTKLPGSTDEKWIRVEGMQVTCPSSEQLDRTGRDSVATVEEAEILCSLDIRCATVIFRHDSSSQDDPEVWLCKEQPSLETAIFNPSYFASIRVWSSQGKQNTDTLLCSYVWFDHEVCGRVSAGLDLELMKELMCWDSEVKKYAALA